MKNSQYNLAKMLSFIQAVYRKCYERKYAFVNSRMCWQALAIILRYFILSVVVNFPADEPP